MPPTVRIADPRGSTPKPLSLLGVALCCTAVGLLLVKLSVVAERPETRALPSARDPDTPITTGNGDDSATSIHRAEPASTEAPAIAAAIDDLGPTGEGALPPDGEVPPPEQAPEAPEAVTPLPSPGGTERTVEPGRVAYFRCPNDTCARDHGLERSVWRALGRLGNCIGSTGDADVRVSVLAGAVTDVRFRERGAAGLNLGVLERCVTQPLMRISGSSLPDGAVASFRFQVR